MWKMVNYTEKAAGLWDKATFIHFIETIRAIINERVKRIENDKKSDEIELHFSMIFV